jgi:ATP-dependent DNA ligase
VSPRLPIAPPFPPMEAIAVDEIPAAGSWEYEPKWDGFRCVAFRNGSNVHLQSKSGQPLARYFPEVVENLLALPATRFVVDGELVVPIGNRLSFDDLLQRIHPAASRVRKLASERPATYILFDLLVDDQGRSLVAEPLEERRRRLEAFAGEHLRGAAGVRLSPATTELATARRWMQSAGGALDGVVAKRLGLEYRSGDRTGMVKVKRHRTADCVVGGFRYASRSRSQVGSLLLGLYDDDGLLHHVGYTSSFPAEQRAALLRKLRPLIRPSGFTGQAPGGPSRWATDRSTEWEPLAPKLVVEVRYGHVSGGRFRHGTKLLRWRPDKAPASCTFEQLVRRSGRSPLALTLGPTSARPAGASPNRGAPGRRKTAAEARAARSPRRRRPESTKTR